MYSDIPSLKSCFQYFLNKLLVNFYDDFDWLHGAHETKISQQFGAT